MTSRDCGLMNELCTLLIGQGLVSCYCFLLALFARSARQILPGEDSRIEDPIYPPADGMSFKKSKAKKSPNANSTAGRHAISSPPSTASGSMPEGAKAKLMDLFGQIEAQFELMHADNVACEFGVCAVTAFCPRWNC